MSSGRKFTSHGKASIMHCELQVSVHCRQQLTGMAEWLIEEGLAFDFEPAGVGDSLTPETYLLTITDIPWATNLVGVAEKLAEFDYDMEGQEEGDGAPNSPPAKQ